MFKCISLFAGIGGFDLALERAGHEIVFANEWDKYAIQTYNSHFRIKANAQDVREIRTVEIPAHDLLVGGFPCQAFSVAGKRRGFEDIRGTLFFEIARILKDKRPTYLLLENVKGLLSHQNGQTFKTILWALDELGYDLQWQVLNSKDFGVPQNRERIFIIGHLRGRSNKPQAFPLGSNSSKNVIAYPEEGPPKNEIASTLTVHYTKNQYGSQYVAEDNIEDRLGIRRLTPLECERLQGFPDGWTIGVSDTQRYKQLGNAVTVNVVSAILERF